MAVFAALGKILGDDAVPIIYSFLDDSSVVANSTSVAADVDAVNDYYLFYKTPHYRGYNYLLSAQLLDIDMSAYYWYHHQ